jgi:hypothetical protein
MSSTTATTRQRWTTWLLNRWPTLLALGAAALTFGGMETDEAVRSFADILPILPLLYLVVAKLRRREATWPGLGIGLAAVVALRVLDVIPQAAVFSAIALIVLVWGAIDGHLRRSGELQVQALGMLGFGALALTGLVIDPEVGRYVVAAGWFLHGVWDFVHLKLNKVVAPSFAEWCGVVDIVIAAELVLKL